MRKSAWVLAGALTLAGCSFGQDVPAAEQQVAKFHEQLDTGQFDAIWQGASDNLRQMGPQAGFTAMLELVHRKLGAVRSMKQTAWNELIATGGRRISLRYQVNYEKGVADEHFVFSVEQGKPLLAGYHVNSSVLVGN